MPSDKGEDDLYRLTEPGVDVDEPFEFRTGYNITPETVKGSDPVFQRKHDYSQESWILKWSEPGREDPEYDMKKHFESALEYLGLCDLNQKRWASKLPTAYVETPDASNSFEAVQIPELLGALNTGFSVTEALETHHRETGEGDSHYFTVGNPEMGRIRTAEITDSAVNISIEGCSRFREDDLSQLSYPNLETEDLLSKLEEKTSDMRVRHW